MLISFLSSSSCHCDFCFGHLDMFMQEREYIPNTYTIICYNHLNEIYCFFAGDKCGGE